MLDSHADANATQLDSHAVCDGDSCGFSAYDFYKARWDARWRHLANTIERSVLGV